MLCRERDNETNQALIETMSAFLMPFFSATLAAGIKEQHHLGTVTAKGEQNGIHFETDL